MAIEGALLRETLEKPSACLRWVDGSQNVADISTKLVLDEQYFWSFIRRASWSLVQERAAAEHKARKRAARTKKRDHQRAVKEEQRAVLQAARRATAAREILDIASEPEV